MEIRNYIEARGIFQERGAFLKKAELEIISERLEALRKETVFLHEKEEIDDLLEDIEIKLDEISALEVKGLPSKAVEIKSGPLMVLRPSYDVMISVLDYSSLNLMGEAEKELYRIVLIKNKGHRTRAARDLGVSIRTLRNKIDDWFRNGEINEVDVSRLCESSEISDQSNGELSA
jgi:DNA-binding NtrC family response regulator